MKDVKQLNLTAGKQTLFEMKLKRSQFLVKNMTDDSISVSLGNNDTVSIIGSGSWERVFNNIENETTGMAEAQIQAYKSLTTFKPTTIISNDAECHMKLTYRATGN